MDTKTHWAQRLEAGGVAFTLPVAEQGLLSDRWRGLVINQLDKLIVTQIQAVTDPRRPAKVLQDKVDMMRALLASFKRALDRRQVSQKVLQGIIRTALASYIVELQDKASRAAAEGFAKAMKASEPQGSWSSARRRPATSAATVATPAPDRA